MLLYCPRVPCLPPSYLGFS